MTLLAPAVEGPLTPLSISVRADGVLPGAHVQVVVGGARYGTGEGWAATANQVRIPLIGFQLPPGASVTATWTLEGESSPPSLTQIVSRFPVVFGDPEVRQPPAHGDGLGCA